MNKSVRCCGPELSICAQCAIKWVKLDSFLWMSQINLSQGFPSQCGLLGTAANHIWVSSPHQSFRTEVMKPLRSRFPTESELHCCLFSSVKLRSTIFTFKSLNLKKKTFPPQEPVLQSGAFKGQAFTSSQWSLAVLRSSASENLPVWFTYYCTS